MTPVGITVDARADSVAQPDLRQSRDPVVATTRGIGTAMTIQMTSEWTLTDSPRPGQAGGPTWIRTRDRPVMSRLL